MKKMVVAVTATTGLVFAPVPVASAAPYVSCPGGYIAPDYGDCPPFRTPISVHPGKGNGGNTGGGGGGGLLGTIGRVLGGIL